MIALLVLPLLAACADDATQDAGDRAADYAPRVGWTYAYAPQGLPDEVPLLLRVDETTWTFRSGEHWDDAEEIAALEWSLDGGLVVDGTALLPERVQAGATTGDATVVSVETDVEVWYGIFPRAALVEVDGGPWLGDHAFAQGYGPIALTWSGQPWELVSYERE